MTAWDDFFREKLYMQDLLLINSDINECLGKQSVPKLAGDGHGRDKGIEA